MLNFATIKNIFQNLSFSFLRLFAVIQMHDIHVHVLVDCPDIDCFAMQKSRENNLVDQGPLLLRDGNTT